MDNIFLQEKFFIAGAPVIWWEWTISLSFLNLVFRNDESIKLGFFSRLMGTVKVFADDMTSTWWPDTVKNCDKPSTCCAIPPIPPDVGEINNIFNGKKSD